MKRIFKNSTVAFLLIIVSISTMGFSVNTLYCFCVNQYEASLFSIEHICKKDNHEEEEDAAYIKTLPSCCQKAVACHKAKSHEDGCTKKEKKYYKADLKYLEIKKSELVDIQWFAAVVSPVINIFAKPQLRYIAHQTAYLHYRPPPQYFGRKLLNFIQVYRC